MKKKNDLLKSTANAEKTFNRVMLAILIVIILLVVCYETTGTSMIKAAYEGKSLQILNEAIKYQHKKPVTHYIDLVDGFFYKGIFAGLVALGFLAILARLTFFRNAIKPIWIIVWGVFILSGICLLNPDLRIFSMHGLMHSNIVYEIMHGNIPPQNPLFGGQPLLWPWGHHFLAAMISKSFNISPPWAFTAINVFSYIGIAYMVFKISELLIKDSRANSFSVIVAIFCSTWVVHGDYDLLLRYLGPLIPKYLLMRVPLWGKFLHSNGYTIGFLFYAFFIYALLRIFIDCKKWKHLLPLLLVSVAGVGFFYFQMFAGLLGGFAVFFSVKAFQYLRNKNSETLQKIILTSVTVCLGVLVILPYALSLTVNAKGKIALLNPAFMWQDFSNILLLSLPLVIIILSNHKNLKKLNSHPAISLVSLLAGAILTYICVRFPSNNDYKFLLQSMALLGIIGGICISFMCTGKKRILVLLIMLILARPFFMKTMHRLKMHYQTPRPGEIGTRLVTTGQEAELYEWILNNTPHDNMFIDTKLSMPYLGQRQLFIAVDEYRNNKRVRTPGYGFSMLLILTDTSGYSPELLEYRYRVQRKIYDPEQPLDDEELRDLFSKNDNLLIVVRQQELQNKFNTENFMRVFLSSEKNIAVFKYTRPGSNDSGPL